MGRKRRLDTVQPIDERREILTEDEPTNEKIKQILSVLLVADLSISDDPSAWIFERTCELIKTFEEFPYFLYKAVWDEEFEAIQWGNHENGETILINYELLDLYLNGPQYLSQRPEKYKNDFYPNHVNNESGAGNRLHYNLVEVFGFNEIRDNLDTYREYPELASFFLKLEDICIRHNIPYQHGIWIEYHHSDFFKADNQIGQPPKRKNSKFFKICQTLKTDYRVRKFPESEQKTVRVENEPPYRIPQSYIMPQSYHQYPPYHIPQNHAFDDLNAVQPSPDFSDANIDQESLSRAREETDSDIHRPASLTDTVTDMFSVRSTVGSAIETN